jgi:hypothetical protein
MRTSNTFALVIGFALALFFGLACGDATQTEPAPVPCYLTPELPECSCDDADPCTWDTHNIDGCDHESVTYGHECIGEIGFCDVGGVCRQECDKRPCYDSVVEAPYGCVYTQRKNGWTCTDESGATGLCDDGECMIPNTAIEACKWHDNGDPCAYEDVNGVCTDGVCGPRTDAGACVAQETKCEMADGAAGWCGTWEWPTSGVLYCRSCEETTCLGVPGCSIVGNVCQGGSGDGGCPLGCCPVCY